MDQPYDKSADLWSLGILALELLDAVDSVDPNRLDALGDFTMSRTKSQSDLDQVLLGVTRPTDDPTLWGCAKQCLKMNPESRRRNELSPHEKGSDIHAVRVPS